MNAAALLPAVLLLPSLAYAGFVWRLGSALPRLPRAASGSLERAAADADGGRPGILVIVPAKNEAAALPATLDALRVQDLPAGLWQARLVDDGSADGTGAALAAAAEEARARGLDWQALATASGSGGKKRAIAAGLAAGDRAWTVVLDADARPGPGWLSALLAAMDAETGLLAGPAVFDGRGPFGALVALEYAGWLSAGLASFAIGRPLFASGANLAWRRRAFAEAGGYEGLEHLPSGDDTLLIQRIAGRTAWALRATLDPAAAVRTRGPESLRAFWRQRVRWTSSEKAFEDRGALAAAVGLYAVFALTAALPLAALAGLAPVWAAAAALALKGIPDARLVVPGARALGQGRRLALLPLVWLLQLAYGLVVPWVGTFGGFRWREAE